MTNEEFIPSMKQLREPSSRIEPIIDNEESSVTKVTTEFFQVLVQSKSRTAELEAAVESRNGIFTGEILDTFVAGFDDVETAEEFHNKYK